MHHHCYYCFLMILKGCNYLRNFRKICSGWMRERYNFLNFCLECYNCLRNDLEKKVCYMCCLNFSEWACLHYPDLLSGKVCYSYYFLNWKALWLNF
jgi:hypothetical protein